MQAAADGVVVGAMVGLAALGLTLVWAVERFPNIAQGDTLTLAAYLTFGLSVGAQLPIVPAAVLAVGGTTLAVQAAYQTAFRPLRTSPRVTLLVASIGVALVIRAIVSLVWGTRLQSYDLPVRRAISLGLFHVSLVDIVILVTVLGLVGAVYWILYRSRAGIEMRAVADVPDLARVTGIDTRRVLRFTWLLSGFVTAVAGVLLGAKIGLTPLLGWNLLLAAFAATVLGSVGHPLGAIAGGFVLGLAMELSTVFISPTFKEAIAFVILAAVLLFRPRGLLAGR